MSARRNLPRPAAAPGRKPARTGRRPTDRSTPASSPSASSTADSSTAGPESPTQQRSGAGGGRSKATRRPFGRGGLITTRAVALAVVLLILTISYATSLRIYVEQRQEIAATKVSITEREAAIVQAERDLARWGEDSYIGIQARERLGWVKPGEVGYRVVHEGSAAPDTNGDGVSDDHDQPAWWEKLLDSVRAADQLDAPPPATPTDEPTITVDTKPKDR